MNKIFCVSVQGFLDKGNEFGNLAAEVGAITSGLAKSVIDIHYITQPVPTNQEFDELPDEDIHVYGYALITFEVVDDENLPFSAFDKERIVKLRDALTKNEGYGDEYRLSYSDTVLTLDLSEYIASRLVITVRKQPC